MSTIPTLRTDALYREHANFANEQEADDAVDAMRTLAGTLERELIAEREKVRVLREALSNCLPYVISCAEHYEDEGLPGAENRTRKAADAGTTALAATKDKP